MVLELLILYTIHKKVCIAQHTYAHSMISFFFSFLSLMDLTCHIVCLTSKYPNVDPLCSETEIVQLSHCYYQCSF